MNNANMFKLFLRKRSRQAGDVAAESIATHQLGMIAQQQRCLAAAEQCYRKSLAISEKQGNEHGAASTYGQLGILAWRQNDYEEAGEWLVRSVKSFAACNDSHYAAQGARHFAVLYQQADANTQAKLAAIWQDADLGEVPQP